MTARPLALAALTLAAALALVAALALLGACAAQAHPAQAHPAQAHPPRARGAPRARSHRTPRVGVASALAQLQRSGAISQAAYQEYVGVYKDATRSLRGLTGTRSTELGAVLSNLEAMARAHQLVPSRLPVAFVTLRRNWEWWTAKPLLGANARVSIPGSRLVWEHYPGQGIEIQWLATFGEANGYYSAHDNPALTQVLGEAIALATQRAGGIAWEYMFSFDGGSPPWTSALSQGTGLQALARAWSITHDQRYLTAAQQALGAFRLGPPEGVLVDEAPGAWYLQYTYAPSERILNGFIQSLVGLYDYARLTGDPLGQQLFEAGDALARVQTPHFDTGTWSRYDQSSESDLGYHDLLTEFLEHLCQRTHEGEPLTAGSAPAGGSGTTGGSAAAAGAGQIPGDEVYCTTAARFRTDLQTPPVVVLLTSTVNAGERAGVQVRLSKISTVTMTVTLGHRTVWSNRATVEGGTPRLLWVTPSRAGVYQVTLRARDPAGNEAQGSGSIMVEKAPKQTRRRGKRHGRAIARTASALSPPARRLPAL
jgi:hypothetical protein